MVRIATEEVNQTLFEEPPRTVEISWARYCCIRQHWLTRGEEYTYSSSSNNIDKLGKVDQANREDNQECLRMQMWNWLLSILDAGYWLFRFLVVGLRRLIGVFFESGFSCVLKLQIRIVGLSNGR